MCCYYKLITICDTWRSIEAAFRIYFYDLARIQHALRIFQRHWFRHRSACVACTRTHRKPSGTLRGFPCILSDSLAYALIMIFLALSFSRSTLARFVRREEPLLLEERLHPRLYLCPSASVNPAMRGSDLGLRGRTRRRAGAEMDGETETSH